MTTFSSDSAHTSAAQAQHPVDAALQLQPQPDGSWLCQAPMAYWNMVGPYGGITAAQMLQAVLLHPQVQGDPLTLTVNYAGPVQPGAVHITAEPVRTNRSSQHWAITLRQRNAQGVDEVCTTATAITAQRRDTFSLDDIPKPLMPAPETCERYDPTTATDGAPALPWLQRYDMRVVQGALPKVWDDRGKDSISQLWVRDQPPRPLDYVALTALCDVFYPRIWLRRARQVPAGTVAMTVYFHADRAQLADQADQHLLAQASAQAFRNGYFDHSAQLWDRAGVLLATSHQIVYYKE